VEIGGMTMAGAHDGYLTTLSVLIAVFASFTALSLATRMRASSGWVRRIWLVGAAVALGGGIWSMHFIAMLAFSMPGMEITYDLPLTLASLAIALLFTAAGFAVTDWKFVYSTRVALAGLLMGSGVVGMHYLGMAAMRTAATPSYEWQWIALSILIAIGAASAAIFLAARDQKLVHRALAAGVMGAAIAGMHFTGMRAASFAATAFIEVAGGPSLGQTYLAVLVSTVTILILSMGLGAAALERVFQGYARREARTALRLRIADVLRTDATKDGLQEVAALIGSHFEVNRTGYGQLDPVEDVFDYDVCWTDGSVPTLLGRLPAAAFGIKIVAALNMGQTVAVDDLLTAAISDEPETRDTARSVDTRAILVVPFVRDGRLRTIVYLNDRRPRVWRREDIEFVEEIAERTRLVIERASAEDQLRQLNATLEDKVQARTRELGEAQEALLHAQKLEAVGQLVSGMAHDFNNVLAAITGALDIVRRRAHDPASVEKYAAAGLEATKRGAKLTAQLLAFARSQRIQLEPLFVCDVIRPLHDLLSRTLGPMIRLDFQLNPHPVPVLADATQIEMTVLNLAINARDAMPDGGTLTIYTAVRALARDHELPDGDYVEITVHDTGIGMDETTLRRAVEPFFTTKPIGKGTGLGLAQIHGSTQQAGGSLRLESKLGEGATVRVLLPRTNRLPSLPDKSALSSGARGSSSLKVLLVDDDCDVRPIIAASLQELGHQVSQAEDGAHALGILESETFDLAIVDFAMPGMNGADLARLIGQRWSSLPILFASGFADTGAIEAAVGPSAKMLRKPFHLEELRSALGAVFGKL
jgi:NO-binding membrane sensor protein with MHYT domain/signal transduction histidine kinase/CheY-like chemotaxis protein